jgi:hypothetical protein
VRFKIVVIVTSACALLSQSVAVYAHDHRPPKVVLTSGGTTQRGELGTFCWWRIDTSSGESRLHCVDLRPVSADGEIVAYDAVFRLPAKAGPHYFVSAYGRWLDEEGTAEDQDAQWAFHLRLKERSQAR